MDYPVLTTGYLLAPRRLLTPCERLPSEKNRQAMEFAFNRRGA
jgi:hypothetical protein